MSVNEFPRICYEKGMAIFYHWKSNIFLQRRTVEPCVDAFWNTTQIRRLLLVVVRLPGHNSTQWVHCGERFKQWNAWEKKVTCRFLSSNPVISVSSEIRRVDAISKATWALNETSDTSGLVRWDVVWCVGPYVRTHAHTVRRRGSPTSTLLYKNY